jgi:hypothetical protein
VRADGRWLGQQGRVLPLLQPHRLGDARRHHLKADICRETHKSAIRRFGDAATRIYGRWLGQHGRVLTLLQTHWLGDARCHHLKADICRRAQAGRSVIHFPAIGRPAFIGSAIATGHSSGPGFDFVIPIRRSVQSAMGGVSPRGQA